MIPRCDFPSPPSDFHGIYEVNYYNKVQ